MTSTLACQQQTDGTTKFLINVGVGDPINWGISVYSNTDYGRGNTGSHDSNYPYFVENFSGSNTQTLYKTYNLQGGYIGTLAPTTPSGGYAYCYFTVTSGGGTCSSLSSATVSGPMSVAQGSTQTFNVNWNGSGPSGTTYNIDLYKDVNYYKSFTSTGKPASNSITIDASNWSIGSHSLYANVWYQCSNGQTPSTGIGSGLGITVTGGGGGGCGACSPICLTGTCPSGYTCSSSGTCVPIGGGGGGGGATCDPTICPPDKNYCVVGSCIQKSYVMYGLIGVSALFILSFLKR